MRFFLHLLNLIRTLASDRARLALENVALRQQIIVLKRTVKRPQINDSDRAFWILMRRMLKSWKDSLHIVRPETLPDHRTQVVVQQGAGGSVQVLGQLSEGPKAGPTRLENRRSDGLSWRPPLSRSHATERVARAISLVVRRLRSSH